MGGLINSQPPELNRNMQLAQFWAAFVGDSPQREQRPKSLNKQNEKIPQPA